MGKLFGTDGIRGQANRPPMDTHTALKIGQAVARVFKKKDRRARVMVGKDTRISGYVLENCLAAGVCSAGGDVYLTGVMPTPGVAFFTQSMRADAGIVISASHNPFQDNGIKIFGGNGYKLPDETEEEIEALILGSELDHLISDVRDMGRMFRIDDAAGRYIVFAKSTFPRDMSLSELKVVLDVGNGATYRVAPAIFSELGADAVTLHNQPNGFNINLDCGSQHTQDLRDRVLQEGAAVGLAFDGDGDRLIAVDEKGQELTGDQVLIVLASSLRNAGLLKSDLLVATVMSNIGLKLACRDMGFGYHMSRVGDRYVLEDMQKLGAVLGGEISGHLIFLDHHTTGDGIITALQLVAAMLREGRPLSELARQMKVFPQELINVEVSKKPPIDSLPDVVKAIQKVEADLGEQGRVLIRYSGTQNACRVMVEGPTQEVTQKHCKMLAEVVKKSIG